MEDSLASLPEEGFIDICILLLRNTSLGAKIVPSKIPTKNQIFNHIEYQKHHFFEKSLEERILKNISNIIDFLSYYTRSKMKKI